MDKDLGFVLDFNLLNICCVILTVIRNLKSLWCYLTIVFSLMTILQTNTYLITFNLSLWRKFLFSPELKYFLVTLLKSLLV